MKNKELILTIFKDAKVIENGALDICPNFLVKSVDNCESINCEKCKYNFWNKEESSDDFLPEKSALARLKGLRSWGQETPITNKALDMAIEVMAEKINNKKGSEFLG